MAKDSFYFQHDYNARNDKKISALVMEFKSAGYGIYWCTAEMLHEEGGEMEFDDLAISAISKDLNEDFDLVKKVIEKCANDYKLFLLSDDNILTANRVRRNLDKRDAISKIRSFAGKAGANAKQVQANAEQKEAKERKGKERKGNIEDENFPNFPISSDLNGLPEINIGSVIQLLGIVKKIDATREDILGLWESFKIQKLDGKKHYHSKSDVYSHFTNWAKDLKIEKYGATKQADGRTRFNAGALDLLEQGKAKFATITGKQGSGT